MLEKGSFNEDDIAPITNRSILSVLERPIPLLQYPMSSWHFLLIVMTTDSMVFHWIWTGINVGNKLWVSVNSIFYLRPVFYLLWLHLSLWLLLLPAHDHLWYQPLMAVLALGRMVSFINIGHSSSNEFPSDYLSKSSFSLGYIQHHSLCEHHHNETGFVNDLWLFYQQPTSE